MTLSEHIKQSVYEIIAAANLAPSVHNTQPWLIETTPVSIRIKLDKRFVLKDGDPTGRQTIISLGIFTEAAALCAAEKGLAADTIFFQNQQAEIFFSESSERGHGTEHSELLRKRRSDRSVYQKIALAPAARNAILSSGRQPGIKTWLVQDEKFIDTLADLTAKGISLALSSPSFREELSRYLIPAWSKKRRGIAIKSLYLPWFLSLIEPLLVRSGIGTAVEARLERSRWQSSSAVVCITSAGDLHEDWFRAGRDYLQAALAIEKAGLSQATSAAAVEASNFHEDIETLLGTKQRLQCVIRIGTGVKKRAASPRVPAESLLVTSN